MPSDPIPDPPLDATPGENPSPPIVPRLSIAHLMLWTLGTGIVLALLRVEIVWFEPARAQLDQFIDADSWTSSQQVTAIGVAPFTGAGIAAVLVAAWVLVRRQALLCSQPGHWLLLLVGVAYLRDAAVVAVRYLELRALLADQDFLRITSLRVGTTVIGNLAVALLLCVAWRFTPEPKRWRFYFAVSGTTFGLGALLTLSILGVALAGLPTTLLTIITGIVVLPLAITMVVSFFWAVAKDAWSGERRGLLHWVGVVVVVGAALGAMAQKLTPVLFLRS